MKTVLTQFEIAVIFAMLLIYFAFFWPPDSYLEMGFDQNLEDSNPYARLANIGLLTFLLLAGIVRRRKMFEALVWGWPIMALVGFASLSAFWSDDPLLVLRRSGVLALSTILAFYIFVRLTIEELVRLLVVAFLIIGTACFLVVAIAPRHGMGGLASDPGAWRGAFVHKNILGSVASLGTIVCGYAFWNRFGSRWFSGGGLLLMAPLTLLSQSKTALLVWPAAIYAVALASAVRRKDGRGLMIAFIIFVAGIAGGAVCFANSDELLAAIGRGADLSGRIGLWKDAVYYFGLRPWLGYGFGAFWRSDAFEANQIWATVLWKPPQAHNGWLELGLSLGSVGIVSVALVQIVFLVRLVRLIFSPRAKFVLLCLLIFTLSVVVNFTEASLLRQADNIWILFVVAFLHLKRETLGLQQHTPLLAFARTKATSSAFSPQNG